MIRRIRNMVAAGLAAVALATPALAQETSEEQTPEPKRIKFGYNALEVGATSDQTDLRARLFTDIDFRVGKYVIGAWGLHEGDPGEGNSYFGRDVFMIGSSDTMADEDGRGGQRAALVMKTDREGVLDAKLGMRDYDVPKILGDYGWFDATVDDKAINAALYVGKSAGRWSFDFLHQIEQPFHGVGRWMYSEAQANLSLGECTSGYIRLELDDLDRHTARAIVGGTVSK